MPLQLDLRLIYVGLTSDTKLIRPDVLVKDMQMTSAVGADNGYQMTLSLVSQM